MFILFSCSNKQVNLGNMVFDATMDINYGYFNSAKGYPIQLKIKSIGNHQESDNIYLHIFHRETGQNAYYYQSSAGILPDDTYNLDVWLGGKGDINKSYEVYLIVNKKDSYPKSGGIYKTNKLPAKIVKKINVVRVE